MSGGAFIYCVDLARASVSPTAATTSTTATPRHPAMDRVKQIASHLAPPSPVASLQVKHQDDVVITMAIRSPLTKAKKGGFKDATYVSQPC